MSLQKKKGTVKINCPFLGRLMGLEPTALGTTIRCSNQTELQSPLRGAKVE